MGESVDEEMTRSDVFFVCFSLNVWYFFFFKKCLVVNLGSFTKWFDSMKSFAFLFRLTKWLLLLGVSFGRFFWDSPG